MHFSKHNSNIVQVISLSLSAWARSSPASKSVRLCAWLRAICASVCECFVKLLWWTLESDSLHFSKCALKRKKKNLGISGFFCLPPWSKCLLILDKHSKAILVNFKYYSTTVNSSGGKRNKQRYCNLNVCLMKCFQTLEIGTKRIRLHPKRKRTPPTCQSLMLNVLYCNIDIF